VKKKIIKSWEKNERRKNEMKKKNEQEEINRVKRKNE
jgi:hypothetical protein